MLKGTPKRSKARKGGPKPRKARPKDERNPPPKPDPRKAKPKAKKTAIEEPKPEILNLREYLSNAPKASTADKVRFKEGRPSGTPDNAITRRLLQDGSPYGLGHTERVGRYIKSLRRAKIKGGFIELTESQYTFLCNVLAIVLPEYDAGFNTDSFLHCCGAKAPK